MATAAEIIARQISARQAEIEARREPASSIERLDAVRSDFNDVYRKAGADGAPFPLRDESAHAFRARLLNGIKGLAPSYRSVDPYQLSGNAFDAVAGEIRDEVSRTLDDKRVGDLDRGGAGLRRVNWIDPYSGQRKTEFFGPVWFGSQLMPPVQYVRSWQTKHPPVLRWVGPRLNQR